MSDIKSKTLEFLYNWVAEGKIPQIRKGMVEDMERFILSLSADQEVASSVKRMIAAKAGEDESNS